MKRIGDLELNAYADGELTPDQQAEVLSAMQQDPQLARRVCELNHIKSQLRLAYATPPGLGSTRSARAGLRWQALAAGLSLLATGLFGGWLMHDNSTVNRFVMLDSNGRGNAPAVAENRETRIVFHVTDTDQFAASELLDDVEQMLNAYREQGKALRVEVVSNSDGLDLLREQLSLHEERISELAGEYDNLTFVACKNTIERIQVSRGIEVKIIPAAEFTESGVNHVVRRQKEGWSYIRV